LDPECRLGDASLYESVGWRCFGVHEDWGEQRKEEKAAKEESIYWHE
jgi:hypothetical protein